jgi:von Willebrand factor type A domain
MAIRDEYGRDAGGLVDAIERLGTTPLTDPRSLATSTLFHALLVLLASLTVMNVVAIRDESKPPTLRGELEPVDNRAEPKHESGAGGGGSPGAIGGLGDPALARRAGETPAIKALRDPAADALLSEILPRTDVKPDETLQRDLPGLPTSGVGLLAGSGSGGGEGEGGGSGGGIGRGIGPGAEFFGAREIGRSFGYVIDSSGSMGLRNALDVAKRELLASLDRLPPDAQISVTFYHLQAHKLTDPQGRPGMMAATAVNKSRVRSQLSSVIPYGGTDHFLALRTALVDKPEVIFFLTDADSMTDSDVDKLLPEIGKSRLQAVEFGRGPDLGQHTPLRRLATTTGGAYRYIDTTQFPK